MVACLLPLFEYLLGGWHPVFCLSFKSAKLHCTAFITTSPQRDPGIEIHTLRLSQGLGLGQKSVTVIHPFIIKSEAY